MTKSYADRFDQTMNRIYGPFVPGSIARAIRQDNYALGMRTCWNPDCLGAFAPGEGAPNSCDGCASRAARARSLYCSMYCYKTVEMHRKRRAA